MIGLYSDGLPTGADPLDPVPRDHPAYVYMRDGDGDGWVCE